LTGVGASIKAAQSISWTIHVRLPDTPPIRRSSGAGLHRGKIVHVWTTLLSGILIIEIVVVGRLLIVVVEIVVIGSRGSILVIKVVVVWSGGLSILIVVLVIEIVIGWS
jgi:hypothetical protein